MKYALGKGRTRWPAAAQDDGPRAAEPAGSTPPAELPIPSPDPRSLARALDRLTREVLQSDRSLEEAWEQLRRDVMPEEHH